MTLLLLIPSLGHTKCEALEHAADMLESKSFIKANHNARALKVEPSVKLGEVSAARSYVYNFPALKDFGFGLPSKNNLQGWSRYRSRMEKSAFFGKVTGWEKKLPDGSSARVRLDWEPIPNTKPEVGIAHYNVEFFKVKQNGKSENFKLKVEFNCSRGPCTEQEVLRHVERMQ